MSVALTKNYRRKDSRTKRLNKNLVRDTNTGRDYELRYDPESGSDGTSRWFYRLFR